MLMCCRHFKSANFEFKNIVMDEDGWVHLFSVINSGAFQQRTVTVQDCLRALDYDDRFGKTRIQVRQLADKSYQIRSVDSESAEVAKLINRTREKVRDIHDDRLCGQRFAYHGLRYISPQLVNQIAATGIDMYWARRDAAHPTAVLFLEDLDWTAQGFVVIDLEKYLDAGFIIYLTAEKTKAGLDLV